MQSSCGYRVKVWWVQRTEEDGKLVDMRLEVRKGQTM